MQEYSLGGKECCEMAHVCGQTCKLYFGEKFNSCGEKKVIETIASVLNRFYQDDWSGSFVIDGFYPNPSKKD